MGGTVSIAFCCLFCLLICFFIAFDPHVTGNPSEGYIGLTVLFLRASNSESLVEMVNKVVPRCRLVYF